MMFATAPNRFRVEESVEWTKPHNGIIIPFQTVEKVGLPQAK